LPAFLAHSELGQSRPSDLAQITSGLPLKADIVRAGRQVSKVPTTDVTRPIQSRRRQSQAAKAER
jgi:hypothetical protein